ncbi:MAG: hypothetical protein JXA35_02855 [Deltaproteobacteria bacterium]|nr:hypothetical protein [Deltaproteobacteria bacterium]
MTRARSRIILSYAKQRVTSGPNLSMKQSPFLENIPAELLSHLEIGDGNKDPGHTPQAGSVLA